MRKISLGDTFKAARLIKSCRLNEILKEAFKNGKAKSKEDSEEYGLSVFLDIMSGCSEKQAETQVYELLAGITEKTPHEVETQSLEATFSDIKKICEENNIVNFINAALDLSSKVRS